MLNPYNSAMPAFLEPLFSNESLLLYLGLFSLFFFLVTLFLIPWLVLRIPEDYFMAETRRSLLGEMHDPVLRVVLQILKNMIGVFFIQVGIMLLVLPGQGLLNILLGIIMIDFPGKYHLQRRCISWESVLHTMNWLRKKGKRAPIKL